MAYALPRTYVYVMSSDRCRRVSFWFGLNLIRVRKTPLVVVYYSHDGKIYVSTTNCYLTPIYIIIAGFTIKALNTLGEGNSVRREWSSDRYFQIIIIILYHIIYSLFPLFFFRECIPLSWQHVLFLVSTSLSEITWLANVSWTFSWYC